MSRGPRLHGFAQPSPRAGRHVMAFKTIGSIQERAHGPDAGPAALDPAGATGEDRPAAMAQDEDPPAVITGTGAAVFGLLGSLLIWLTMGAGPLAKYAWVGVGVGAALMLGTKYLPAPAAQPLTTVCARV